MPRHRVSGPGHSRPRGVNVQVTRDDGLITVDQAAQLARVRPATIKVWVHRGHLAVAGIGDRTAPSGRVYRVSLYRPLDVLRAEQKTRKAARRIILPPAA
jgi:hypothetical protein